MTNTTVAEAAMIEFENDASTTGQSVGDEAHDGIPTRTQGETEGVAGALLYSVRDLGIPDAYGVTIAVNEASSYAEVTIDIPERLPQSSKDQLRVLDRQRIYYTAMDRVYDDHFGNPSSSPHHKSVFVTTVIQACEIAYRALTSACFAHARGQDWLIPVQPVERDDWRYEHWWESPDAP